MTSLPSRQTGAALIVSLIMLTLITLLAIASFKLGKSNLQIVGNMQQRNQALGAAQGAIDQVVSNSLFITTPANAIANPCNGAPNTTCVDVNGDGVPDVSVKVSPACIANHIVPGSQLNPTVQSDQNCMLSSNPTCAGTGSCSSSSLCADTVWNTHATASDNATGAQYVIDEGTKVRIPSAAASTTCP
jgi:Tfp pilus assembly protein PilX